MAPREGIDDIRGFRRAAREAREQRGTGNPDDDLQGPLADARRRGRESFREKEEKKRQEEEAKKRREQAAARGAAGMDWGVVGGGAALAAGGLVFATGKVLELALLGWSIDGSGNIRKDTATLGAFERTYSAMKNNEGIFRAIGKGMGMAA